MLRDIEDLIFFAVGDRMEIFYSETDNPKIRVIERVTAVFE